MNNIIDKTPINPYNQLRLDDPSILVMHYTAVNFQKTDEYFSANGLNDKIIAHYVIDDDGGIYHYMEDNLIARHAGTSYWNNFENINQYSIGIENVNLGYSCEDESWQKFPDEQIDELINLSIGLIDAYDIKPYNIVGHSDISVPAGRKTDPGLAFPWEKLATENGIGMWHNINITCPSSFSQIFNNLSNNEKEELFISKLMEFGYQNPQYTNDEDNSPYGITLTNNKNDITLHIKDLIQSYNLHYRQDKGVSSKIDEKDFEIINSLNCLKNVMENHTLSRQEIIELYETTDSDYLISHNLLDFN